LLGAIYDAPLDVAKIAGLAPSILAFAGKGNRVSTKIVQGAAQELSDLVKATANAAELIDTSPTIVFAGGLLRENSLLSFLLETRVTNDVPGCAIERQREEPVLAALRFAENLAS
jgi:N-acetylglucosamine kinase-like BadF-type ATPase